MEGNPVEILRDVKQQCEFVLTQNVGVEARTLATIILQIIDPEDGNDD